MDIFLNNKYAIESVGKVTYDFVGIRKYRRTHESGKVCFTSWLESPLYGASATAHTATYSSNERRLPS